MPPQGEVLELFLTDGTSNETSDTAGRSSRDFLLGSGAVPSKRGRPSKSVSETLSPIASTPTDRTYSFARRKFAKIPYDPDSLSTSSKIILNDQVFKMKGTKSNASL